MEYIMSCILIGRNLAKNQQIEFDEEYITSSEIMKTLNISRAGFLYGRRVGKLPDAIVVNDGRLFIWKRQEVSALLATWKEAISSRKAA
jgi:hypothetical protein